MAGGVRLWHPPWLVVLNPLPCTPRPKCAHTPWIASWFLFQNFQSFHNRYTVLLHSVKTSPKLPAEYHLSHPRKWISREISWFASQNKEMGKPRTAPRSLWCLTQRHVTFSKFHFFCALARYHFDECLPYTPGSELSFTFSFSLNPLTFLLKYIYFPEESLGHDHKWQSGCQYQLP